MSALLTYCPILFCYVHLVGASDTTTTEPFMTMAPEYRKIMQDLFLPPDYEIPINMYDWNITDLAKYINQKDPDLLYLIDTAYLVQLFPEFALRQLPRDILTAHELYHLLPPNDTLSSNTSLTSNHTNAVGADMCLFPFVTTKHDSYFKWEFEDLNVSFECGLLCEYGDVVYGIKPDQQAIADWFNYICAFVLLFMLLIVFINQCMDHRLNDSEDACCHRGFMYHAPICLAVFYAVLGICLALPFFVDKEQIVCAPDVNGHRTVSLGNPGGSLMCTVIGSTFHTTMSLFGLYTLGFTFVLWRQFFAPLQSLWSRLSRYKLCCACVCCVDRVLKPIQLCINARSRYENAILKLQRTNSVSSTTNVGSGSIRKKATCYDVLCGTTTWAHYVLFSIAFTITGLALWEDSFDGFTPLGICTVGGKHEHQRLRYTLVPFTVVFAGCTFFLPYAIYLLWQVSQYSTNTENKKMMRKLGTRMLIFFVCMELCLYMVCQTAWVFYANNDKIMAAAEERMFCLTYRAATGDVDECFTGFSLSINVYIQMALSMPLAGLASVGLSCHWKNRKRWWMLVCACADCVCLRRSVHEVDLVTRMHLKGERPPTSATRTGSVKSTTITTPKSLQLSSSRSDEKGKNLSKTCTVDMVDNLPSISRLQDIQGVSGTVTVSTNSANSAMETGPSESQKVAMSSNSSMEVEMTANNEVIEEEEEDEEDEEVP